MSIQKRRERERAERERLIITAARELAENEGWNAVTTRRLAAEIEYSQPVLYSHFSGKDAIMAAVAVEGFAELATELHHARTTATTPAPDDSRAPGERPGPHPPTPPADSAGPVTPGELDTSAHTDAPGGAAASGKPADAARVLAAVAAAYADFAERRPALYDAMFSQAVDLPFASSDAPDALQRGFGELREALRPVAGEENLDVLTETFWSGLHGLLTLMRDGRLRREQHDARLAALIRRFSA